MDTQLTPIRSKWIGRRRIYLEEKTQSLVQHFGLHPLVARILAVREKAEVESADEFLYGTRLWNPSLMVDMDKTVKRIRQAVSSGEKVLVYGDYDVDGTCATTLVVETLRSMGGDPDWYVPSRFSEGYGLHTHVVQQAAENRISLIITVDTGITAIEAAEAARELKIDLVVTDHHNFSDKTPKAYAIVHLRFGINGYPNKDLCGTGVAFKLAHALLEREPTEYLDLVAVATIADQVPLVGENRVLVKKGLIALENTKRKGLQLLLTECNMLSSPITATDVAFRMAPRINAVGRLAHANSVVRMLLTDDAMEASQLAHEATLYNTQRQRMQEHVEEMARLQIQQSPQWLDTKGLVVSGEGFHEGVIGIAAGKMADHFYRPTLCISIEGDLAKGSGRAGVPDLNLHRILSDVQERTGGVFTHFGGHAAACGFSLYAKDIDRQREAFVQACDEEWTEDVDPAHYLVDAPLALSELSNKLIEDLRLLEPFGQSNPEPVFYIKEAEVLDVKAIGKGEKHLRIGIRDGSTRWRRTLLAFGKGDDFHNWLPGTNHRLLVTLSENVWQGERSIQLRLVDFLRVD